MGADGSLFIGMQSGTSVDGIDAVLVRFIADDRADLVATSCTPYPDGLADTIRAALERPGEVGVDELARLDARIGEAFGAAANALIARAQVTPEAIAAIGSHGQTVQHGPDAVPPFTLQLGDPARIAEHTGCPVIGHIRTRDVAAGGQGAPLAPALHAALLRSAQEERAVLNLGGVANLTILPAASAAPVLGFDTGPANSLSDAWCRRHLDRPFDDHGAWAASAEPDAALLEDLSSHGYFALPPPKSTGPEVFNEAWVLAHQRTRELPPAVVQATLVELTARTVAAALGAHAPACGRLLVCGGGVCNTHLMARLESHCACPVESTADHGLAPAWVEAILFAWIARRHLAGKPGNLPSVTGARGRRILGALYPP